MLEVDQVKEALIQVLPEMKSEFVVLIDKLDEGYQSDDVGTALADGLVLATINLAGWLPNTRVTLFARDNVARAVARADPDYSRNIEGQILRLPATGAARIDPAGDPTIACLPPHYPECALPRPASLRRYFCRRLPKNAMSFSNSVLATMASSSNR